MVVGAGEHAQSQSSEMRAQDYEDGQRRLVPSNEDDPQTSSFAETQDGGRTRETERMDRGVTHMRSPALPEHGGHASAAMFPNAKVTIHGGTFQNDAHIYGCDLPAQGGGPAFPIAVLGLPVMSFATCPRYPHCDHLFDPFPLPMPQATSKTSVALILPFLYRQTEIMGSLALWFLLIKPLVQRWATRHL